MKTINSSKISLLTGILLVAILSLVSSCKKPMDNTYNTGNNGNNTGGTGGATSPGVNEVWIQNMAFTPGTITVVAGTKITWTNKDAIAHTVTSDSLLFNSGSIATGGTFAYTFSTPGTFTYHCSVHPGMKATVVVTKVLVTTGSVSIQSMAFAPATLTVSAGAVVTWSNNDAVAHTVTSDTGLFDSGSLAPAGNYSSGGTFSYTFATAGTYNYHCTVHPMMTGTIIVN